MLKGKKGIYVLLPIVVFIWVAIGYQVIDAFREKETPEFDVATTKPISYKNMVRDTFSISKPNRDPFLNTLASKKKTPKKKATPKPKVKKERVRWPRISYKGKVSEKKGHTTVYVVEINNEINFMKINSVTANVKMLKAEEKKIVLTYKGETKEIQISE